MPDSGHRNAPAKGKRNQCGAKETSKQLFHDDNAFDVVSRAC